VRGSSSERSSLKGPVPRPATLTRRSLVRAVRVLAGADPAVHASVERFGTPPLWAREPSFGTLVHLILEQQVSLASARVAFERLGTALDGAIVPERFLELDDRTLRAIGFSRQKTGYARGLALALTDGFDLGALERMSDEDARTELMRLRGIGRWTADVYLTMCLLRSDVWPHGDQALVTGAVELLGLGERPTFEELHERAERWRPYRAVAARIVWHHYLGLRGRAD
jgi:DNA-3-methyladenine glycosylase II